MNWRMLFLLLASLSIPVSAACESLIGDAVWLDERTVQVNPSSSSECVKKAIVEIKEVAIDDKLSTPTDIVLKIRQEQASRKISGHVRRQSQTTFKVFFAGKGTKEPDDVNARIKSLLTSISGAIQRTCGQ
jgi:hypothetical protein